MSDTDKFKGEWNVMYLLKESQFPLLDIVDLHIVAERDLAARKARKAPEIMFLSVLVYRAFVDEVRTVLEAGYQGPTPLRVTWQGDVYFSHVKIAPFFANDKSAERLPGCSMLMILDGQEVRGL